MMSHIPPFKVHLDPADMDFLKKESEECKGRQKNALLSEGQTEPYVKIVASLEQALAAGTATGLTKPLRAKQQADRERRMPGKRQGVVVAARLLCVLSPTPTAGSPVIVKVPVSVPSTIFLDVVASSQVPKTGLQSSSALLIGSPGALSIQLKATQHNPFAQEMRTASISSRARTTATSESIKQPSEVAIPLEAKEQKKRRRPRKEQKKSGRSHEEKDLPTRRRDESDSDGEGNGKPQGVRQNGLRRGNGKGKYASNRESIKSGATRAHSPKGQHSCTSAMGRKHPTVKSVERRVQPTLETVSEPAVVSATPTPML